MDSLNLTRRILSWGSSEMGLGPGLDMRFGLGSIAAWAGLSILAAGGATLSTWLFRRQQVLLRRLSSLRLLEADNHSLRRELLALQSASLAANSADLAANPAANPAEQPSADDSRLRTVLENMPVMLNAFDERGELQIWNAECERLTGYQATEILDNPRAMVWLYPDADYRSTMMSQWQSRGNDFRNWEWDITCKDGTVKTIAWSNISDRHPIRGWSSWAIGVDVSDRKQTAQTLKAAKDAAEAANLAKSRFLANMSHELRTPLSSILGFSQLMASDSSQPPLSPQHQEYLGIINRSGEDLLGLINDVLEVSKIEAGGVTLQIVAFDLHELLQRLEETLGLQAHVKGLDLRIVCPRPAASALGSTQTGSTRSVPQYIQADEGKLYQILLNLLGNAIKFTERGFVALHIEAQSLETRPLETQPLETRPPQIPGTSTPTAAATLASSSDALLLRFAVEDTGPGIAPADLKELFKPFAQTRTGQNIKGSGLGLFISKRFVKLMAGRLWVESRLGHGTRFTCEIPVQVSTQAHLLGPASSRANRRIQGIAPGQRQFRILVAEDRPTNRLLLLQILTPLGFEVWQAEHGQEAVEMSQKLDLDLILMDMRMPVMDGYEATRRIQQLFAKRGDRPKIIALTASAFEEDRRRMMALGCDDFIRKPFDREAFLVLIGQQLGVQYLYEEMQVTPDPPRDPNLCDTFSLASMSSAWRQQLHYAAAQGSDRKLFELIDQIPEQHSELAAGLTELVTHYRFDRVMELAQR